MSPRSTAPARVPNRMLAVFLRLAMQIHEQPVDFVRLDDGFARCVGHLKGGQLLVLLSGIAVQRDRIPFDMRRRGIAQVRQLDLGNQSLRHRGNLFVTNLQVYRNPVGKSGLERPGTLVTKENPQRTISGRFRIDLGSDLHGATAGAATGVAAQAKRPRSGVICEHQQADRQQKNTGANS